MNDTTSTFVALCCITLYGDVRYESIKEARAGDCEEFVVLSIIGCLLRPYVRFRCTFATAWLIMLNTRNIIRGDWGGQRGSLGGFRDIEAHVCEPKGKITSPELKRILQIIRS